MKKLIAGILAAAMCLAAAACSTPPDETAATTTTAVQTPIVTTTADDTPVTTTADITPVTTTAGEVPPDTEGWTVSDDIEQIAIGNHVTLVYNGASADVKYEVKKGVGSRETVTVEVRLHDGYLFDGWSEGDAIVNGAAPKSKELTYTLNATKATTLYINTSMQIVYHENGGTIVKSGFDGTDTFSAVFYHNPNTLPEQGYFARDGYTLTGYNTKADGTGESVSLGSKVTGGRGIIDVYCVWEKNTDASAFDVAKVNGGWAITDYTGTDANVVIPATIDGKNVVKIDDYAFSGNTVVERIVVPSTVHTIEPTGIENCPSLHTVVLFDSLKKVDSKAFQGCPALTNVRLNTLYTLTTSWMEMGAAKIDRLMWAKDKKKIVIIGGSGSLFGFDCSVIDEALGGEYEIINFGENANISAIMYFDLVEDFVREGDIILWCPEPGWSTLGRKTVTSQFWGFRKSNYDFAKYINPQNLEGFFSGFAANGATLQTSKYKSYDELTKGMNKYGDNVSDRETQAKSYRYNFSYPMMGEKEIKALVANMTAKGVSVYYSFAAMQETAMKSANEKDVLALEALVTSVPGIVSISDYKDCIYPDNYFHDSEWHMTDDGARARSAQVAEDLLKALGKS
ncbi:MAG: leucine-rich repeat protein [Clostridia bacterium]|nr:leucine-rich repeat protein [Clostridia bacterium]